MKVTMNNGNVYYIYKIERKEKETILTTINHVEVGVFTGEIKTIEII